MIQTRLKQWLEKHKKLDPNQAGACPKRTATDLLIKLEMAIQQGFQQKNHTLAVMIDFAQAFDSVWSDGLILKLAKMGVSGKLLC